jgi:predicted nucleic acid-binding Zn ribbon protein
MKKPVITYLRSCILCGDAFTTEYDDQQYCGAWCAFWNNNKKHEAIKKRNFEIKRLNEAKKV